MANALYFIHALTPVHAGTGQGMDAIDLPIARERSTSLPYIPGSSLKGCLRDARSGLEPALVQTIFGPDRQHAADNAGAISVSDGQLILFPVRSLAGTFVWATSPYLLARLQRDAAACSTQLPAMPAPIQPNSAIVASESVLLPSMEGRMVLEELDFTGKVDDAAINWAKWFGDRLFSGESDETFRRSMLTQFAILGDRALFSLTRTATEVQAHIALDEESGTVLNGALWYQESLPAETVLTGVIRAGVPRHGGSGLDAHGALAHALPQRDRIQIGGKAGTGQGWVRLVRAGGAA